MAEEVKPVRLSKAAKEVNVSVSTIVEFLAKKGHTVDSNPNTKLTGEQYTMVLKEFQSDKVISEKAQELTLETVPKKEKQPVAAKESVKNADKGWVEAKEPAAVPVPKEKEESPLKPLVPFAQEQPVETKEEKAEVAVEVEPVATPQPEARGEAKPEPQTEEPAVTVPEPSVAVEAANLAAPEEESKQGEARKEEILPEKDRSVWFTSWYDDYSDLDTEFGKADPSTWQTGRHTGRYMSSDANKTFLRFLSFNRLAILAEVVVLPEPCRPTIKMQTGGTAFRLSSAFSAPRSLTNSSWTILTTICPG